jgi:hypothetical protein
MLAALIPIRGIREGSEMLKLIIAVVGWMLARPAAASTTSRR